MPRKSTPAAEIRRRMRLVTLGSPRLDITSTDSADGEKTEFIAPGKPLALITFLAFAPRRTATRDRLCDLLWGDRDIEAARTQLRNALWSIGQPTQGGFLARTRADVTLVGELDCDAHTFAAAIEANQLDRALDLYRGEFFAEYRSPGADRFEEWASLERARLRALFVHTAESLAGRALDVGRPGEAIRLARRIRDEDPHGELGWRLLLTALAASGDTLAARAEADHFEAWLQSDERQPEPASTAALKAARRAARSDTPTPDQSALIAELVGREREFAAIYETWQVAKARGTRRVRIVAPSGLGKTRLALDVAARLRASRERVVYRHANLGERYISFSLAAGLAAALAELPGARGVSPGAASVLVRLNPSLSAAYPSATPRPDADARSTGLTLLELISAVADESPLAILIDDLHWCDTLSRDALTVVESQLEAQHVLLVTTARPRHLEPAFPDTVEITLSPLSVPQVEQLIASTATLPDTPWARTLPALVCECSSGSPLYALEALRLCLDRGVLERTLGEWHCANAEALGDTLRQSAVIGRRLNAMSEAEQTVVLLLSVAAAPVPPAIIARAAHVGETEIAATGIALEQRGLLAHFQGLWSVAHDEIGDAAMAAAGPERVTHAHAVLGAALALSADDEWQRRAISHLAQGGDWDSATRMIGRLVRPRRTASPSVMDREIASLLGACGDPANVARVRRGLPFRTRHPYAGAVAASALFLLAVGSAAAVVSARNGSRLPPEAILLVASPNADGSARVRRIGLEREAWDATRPLVVSGEARAESWARFGGRPEGPIILRPGHSSWAAAVVSPDSGEGDIELRDANGRRTRLTWGSEQEIPHSFSPDGEQLVFRTNRWSTQGWSSLAVMDMRTRAVRRLTASPGTDEAAIWSPRGTLIAFMRQFPDKGVATVCTIHSDGTGERCPDDPGWHVSSLYGWIDDHRLLVRSERRDTSAVAILDVGTWSMTQTAIQGTPEIDATGRWLIVRRDDRGVPSWRVSPLDRPELSRALVTTDSGARPFIWFMPPARPGSYLDRIAIDRPAGALPPNVPHQMQLSGWTKGGTPVSPAAVRWRTLTPALARIDSLGVLVAADSGTVVIEATAGGWRSVRDTIRIDRVPAKTVLVEEWEGHPLATRWRAFGDPLPIVTASGERLAFLNNGDGRFFSGAYLRSALDQRRGLSVDLEISTPISQTQWQQLLVLFYPFRDSLAVRKWDHRTGYISHYLDSRLGCGFVYPQGEGPKALAIASFGDVATATRDPRARLDTGDWYRVRLQLFPDGRCGVALNGRPLQIGVAGNSRAGPVHLVVEGSSVGSRLLVGRVRIAEGVPDDIDWTTLQFDNEQWRLPREPRKAAR